MDHFGIILILVTLASSFHPALPFAQRLKSLERLSKASSDFFLKNVKGLRERLDRRAQMGPPNRTLLTSMAFENLPQPQNVLISKQNSNQFVNTDLSSIFSRPKNGESIPSPPRSKTTNVRPELSKDILSMFNTPIQNREGVINSGYGLPSPAASKRTKSPTINLEYRMPGRVTKEIERTPGPAAPKRAKPPTINSGYGMPAPVLKETERNPGPTAPKRVTPPTFNSIFGMPRPVLVKKKDERTSRPPAPRRVKPPSITGPLSIYNLPITSNPVDQIPAYDMDVGSIPNTQSQTTVNVKSTDPAPPTASQVVSIEMLISKQDELFGLILQYHTEMNKLIQDILAKLDAREL